MDEQRPPNVVPLSGYRLPPPPGWREPPRPPASPGSGPPPNSPGSPTPPASPDDFLSDGRLRCTACSKSSGERCRQPAVTGTHVCRFHGAGGAVHHEDSPTGDKHVGTVARKRRTEVIRQHLETIATTAVAAVRDVLTDPSARPADRLKAAELVLDRTVGRQLALEAADTAERDLDREILEVARSLRPTGTEGGTPTPPAGGDADRG